LGDLEGEAMNYIVVRFVLAPLIRRDKRLRAAHLRPDRWYWADLLAIRLGFIVDGGEIVQLPMGRP